MVFIRQYPDITPAKIRELANKESSKRTYERYLAIALLLEGKSSKEVAALTGKSYNTILNWVTEYNYDGVDGLTYKAPLGNSLWLSEEQFEILKLAVQKSPQESNIDSIQWTYKELIQFIEKNFSITIKKRTAQKYFNRMGFVRKRPKQQYARASEEKKKEFIEKIKYLESIRSPNSLTFYIDEVKFYDKPDLRAMWVLKGHDALVKTFRTGREKVIFYGAYCFENQDILVQDVLEETSELTASFLITIRAHYPHRRLDVILDNAPWHYGSEVKRIAKIYRINLHYLPPYSPDLNPIEALWDWVKDEVTVNQDYPSFNKKKEKLNDFFTNVVLKPMEIETRMARAY